MYRRDFQTDSASFTNAVYFTKPWRKRYQFQGFLAAESISNSFKSPTGDAKDDQVYPKAGIGFGLFF